jgi:Flp pilus assembly protein TadG
LRKINAGVMSGDSIRAMAAMKACSERRTVHSALYRAFCEESGQVLPWVVLLMLMFLGICALVIDVGHGVLVQRQLQASTDAAALAAAATMPSSTYSTVGQNYSSAAGKKNAYAAFSVGTPTITPLCITSITGLAACTATNPNAVSVTESATVPTFFAGSVGIRTITINAKATAARGSKPLPYNVALILDTTPSMGYSDPSCGSTQLACATAGAQQLLLGLAPSLDHVSLFTFPNITTGSVSNDYDCTSSSPTVGPYTFPSTSATTLSNMPYITTTGTGRNQTTTTVYETYQVTDYLTNYRSSDTSTTLSTGSELSNALGIGVTSGRHGGGCTGIQTSSNNTYYAGAIYAAQASLDAEKAANSGTTNVIILLSDGNATAQQSDMVTGTQSTTVATNSGTYPSWVGECGQGVDAANYATSQGTIVYTIAYGSPSTSSSSNCASDRSGGAHKNITPCQAMQQMSSGWSTGDTSHFYSDYNLGGDTGCQATGAAFGVADLSSIFAAIQNGLAGARLVPNNVP